MAFVSGIYRWAVDSPHKGPGTRKMFQFDGVIMMYKSQYIDAFCNMLSQFEFNYHDIAFPKRISFYDDKTI